MLDNIARIATTKTWLATIIACPVWLTVIEKSILSYKSTINGIKSVKMKYWKMFPGSLKSVFASLTIILLKAPIVWLNFGFKVVLYAISLFFIDNLKYVFLTIKSVKRRNMPITHRRIKSFHHQPVTISIPSAIPLNTTVYVAICEIKLLTFLSMVYWFDEKSIVSVKEIIRNI